MPYKPYVRTIMEGGVQVSRGVVELQVYVVCTVDSSPEVLCLSKHQCLKGKGLGGIGNPGIARAST